MPSPLSMTGNSSRATEVGNTSLEGIQKSVYEAWSKGAKSHLFQWLDFPGNYEKWKCAWVKSSTGSTKTSGLTKKAVTKIISEYLETLQTKKTPEQVMSRMRYIEKKFKDAEDYLRNTGEGITATDDKMEIVGICDKVLSICPFYYQVKSFMSESTAVNPPYLGETGTNESFKDMLFGNNIAERLDERLADDIEELNSVDENSSSKEEPDYEADITTAEEPIPETASEGTILIYCICYFQIP